MMTDPALYKLLTWTSPGYPTGAFSYSHGLEWAVETGDVKNLQGLLDYVTAVISRGGGWVDAVLFAHAWQAAGAAEARLITWPAPPAGSTSHGTASTPAESGMTPMGSATLRAGSTPPPDQAALTALDTLTQLAAAFRGSSETALESRQQGGAFLDVTRKAWPHPLLDAFAARQAQAGTPVAHGIAVAVACAAHEIALAPALHSYIHAVAANLVSAGARLIPLGQTQAQIAIAQLAPMITDIVGRAQATSLDDLGTAAPAIELCSLRHETQYTRLFRS